MLEKSHPESSRAMLVQAQEEVNLRWKLYQHLAARDLKKTDTPPPSSKPTATAEVQA